MMPPSTTPSIGEARRHEEGHGYGLVLFASILLVVIACFNLIYGIAAIANSHVFTAHAHYVFGNLKTWGWVTLILGVLEVLASVSLFQGGAFGRFFGIAVASLAAIDALLSIPAYPFWSIALFALALWIIHGLVVYGEPER